MAHELDMSTGKAAIALRGGKSTAWHGLGQEIKDGDSIQTIMKKAGLAWEVLTAKVTYTDDEGHEHTVPDMKVNFRADTKAPLGVVSQSKFNIVQPKEVLEFFRDFLSDNRMQMETAGALKGGKIIWALAKLGKDYAHVLPGKDKIDGYFRLQTGFDSRQAQNGTNGVGTTIRQVCANTMRMIDTQESANIYRIPHSTVFDAQALKKAVGLLGAQHKVTADFFNELIKRKVNAEERRRFFVEGIFNYDMADYDKVVDGKPVISGRTKNAIGQLEAAFANGPGAGLKSAKDTAFGLLNAVTFWVDHEATAIDKYEDGKERARLASAWFGLGERTKRDAMVAVAELAGCRELVAA
jgi:phage/plasmid-like protein (TIGR03299 family)